jgi:TRAP-type C4-dicarboxylate transport system permease large subunit
LKKSLEGTLRVSVMAFMIIAASKTYSAILAFSGSPLGLVSLINDIQMSRLVVLICMMLTLMILGTFREQVCIDDHYSDLHASHRGPWV